MKGPGALGPTKPPRMSGAGGPGPHLPPRMSGAGGPRPHLPPPRSAPINLILVRQISRFYLG